MTTQLSLLQRDWVNDAIPVVLEQARDGRPFTADKFHAFLPVPEHNNWFGVLIAAMKNRGLIEKVGYVPSTRKERNGAVVASWRLIEKREVAA